MKVTSASVVICTYNRAVRLAETLAAVQAMTRPDDCDVEIVVIDNNSTDDTRAVVEEAARRGPLRIVYAHEPQQGKSFALNTALALSRTDILALTDDDVIPARDWLARIVGHFRARDVTFVFGKVLPRWAVLPPPELLTARAQDVWGPLALVDYGDAAVAYVAENFAQPLPIGANVAFVRSALMTIGGWRIDLGKVNNTLISGEDHEIFMRLRRHGLYSGYYDPDVAVRHYVPASRLTRRYFRRWFFWHGKTQALMLDDLFPKLDMTRVRRIGGVPRFLYRDGLHQIGRYAATALGGRALEVLIEELRVIQFLGLCLESWRHAWARRPHIDRDSTICGPKLATAPAVDLPEGSGWKARSSSWHPVQEGAEKC
jgi:glucosyl-dolichyl phosphate glucuronosyltransferase